MNNKNVVFIADKYKHKDKIKINSYDLEMVNEKYYNDVYNGLLSFCNNVTFYDNPMLFLKNIEKHRNDVVLSVWSGTKSKSRKGIVPAICEAYNIKYVGSDCYTQILCQDKALAKEFCNQFEIKSPRYKILTKQYHVFDFSSLQFPLIIKPLCEGGSIGISNSNLVYNPLEAEKKCKTLLNHYDSIMAEEYIDGYELCVILFGNKNEILVKGASMLEVEGESYLKNFIWGYEYKKADNSPKKIKSVDATHLLTKEDWQKFENVFFSLGKVELIRIDGRINENGFNLIELSPDPHIGSGASVAKVFNFNNIEYVEMLKMLIENAR